MKINNRNKIAILVSLFTALTAIGAYIKIPLPHIPITLQTFFVILSGNLLGFKYGSISQVLYLVLGLIGIPIFAYGGGPGYIFQPSFGYLLGYPICAFTIGIILKIILSKVEIKKISKSRFFLIFLISDIFGISTIFIFGLGFLYINIRGGLYLNIEQTFSTGLNWIEALKTALFLFIPIDLIKAFLAVWVTITLKKFNIFCFN